MSSNRIGIAFSRKQKSNVTMEVSIEDENTSNQASQDSKKENEKRKRECTEEELSSKRELARRYRERKRVKLEEIKAQHEELKIENTQLKVEKQKWNKTFMAFKRTIKQQAEENQRLEQKIHDLNEQAREQAQSLNVVTHGMPDFLAPDRVNDGMECEESSSAPATSIAHYLI